MFNIELVAAGHGDCLWIEYGDPAAPSRILIDCGPQKTYQRLQERINALPARGRDFDLCVLTHIDADHIGGAIPLLQNQDTGIHFADTWFNGWQHLTSRLLGPLQAEIISTLIRDRELSWNACCDNGPIQAKETGKLPVFTLPGGMQLTILSPTPAKLGKLQPVWAREIKRHGLVPGSTSQFHRFLSGTTPSHSTDIDALADTRSKVDTGAANGSSIAFLAEFAGKSALLVGDAHTPVITSSIRRLLTERGQEKLVVDAFKLSHHASQGNLSNDLLQMLDCSRYLVSTNGSYFHHPDREAIARVIKYGGDEPIVYFNFRSNDNKVWAREDLQERYGYRAEYPEEGEEGIWVSL
jgi:beta-lactamase superfamily II metal-dependent hydrolase